MSSCTPAWDEVASASTPALQAPAAVSALEEAPDAQEAAADGDGASREAVGEEVQLTARWGARSVPVVLSPVDWQTLTLRELKQRLDSELDVPHEKMRLMGFTNACGQAVSENDRLCDLSFKKTRTFMLMGTVREQQLREPPPQAPAGSPPPPPDPGSVIRTELHLERLRTAIETTTIHMINQPRQSTKLLVLDLDYTVFDCKSSAPITQCKRPFTDELLAEVYPFYDIVVWSQTRWHWVEAKLTELGLLTDSRFCIAWCMDRSSMFTVTSAGRDGQPRIHEVKALEVIWAKFPAFGPHNTVHVDDLSRNFAMNPRNGIEVTPFRVKHGTGDVELQHLTAYLLSLVAAPDLSQVDHWNWRSSFV